MLTTNPVRSPFDWRDGTPSIFCDEKALRYAKAYANVATKATERHNTKPRETPQPAVRKKYLRHLIPKELKKSSAKVDMARLKELRAMNWPIKRIATEMKHSRTTISNRLLLLEGKK